MQAEPCPFCANVKVQIRNSHSRSGAMAVECLGCGALGPAIRAEDPTTITARALQQWNARTEVIGIPA